MSSHGTSLIGATDDKKLKLIVEKFFRVPVLSTTELNKLQLEKGLMVFNTTITKLQVFDGTDWVSSRPSWFGGGGAGWVLFGFAGRGRLAGPEEPARIDDLDRAGCGRAGNVDSYR